MRSLEEILGGLRLSRSATDELVLAVEGASKEALRALAQRLSEISHIQDVITDDGAVCAVCEDGCDVNSLIVEVYRNSRDWLSTLSQGMRARFFGV